MDFIKKILIQAALNALIEFLKKLSAEDALKISNKISAEVPAFKSFLTEDPSESKQRLFSIFDAVKVISKHK